MGVGGLFLHFFDIDDLALVVEECDRQWYQGIFHPHANAGGAPNRNYTALIGAHLFANIRPCSRSASFEATSALIRYSPALRVVVLNLAACWAPAVAVSDRLSAAERASSVEIDA